MSSAPTDDDRRARRHLRELAARCAELDNRERRIAAREAELGRTRALSRLWWMLRVVPSAALELVAAIGLLAGALLLSGSALAVEAAAAGVLIVTITLGRLLICRPPA